MVRIGRTVSARLFVCVLRAVACCDQGQFEARRWLLQSMHRQRGPPPKVWTIAEQIAIVTIQSFFRMLRDRAYVRDYAHQVYEKLLDSKRMAFYYYNNLTGEASWFKPTFLGTEDIYFEDNYDYYKSDEFQLARYKINKYDLQFVESPTKRHTGEALTEDEKEEDAWLDGTDESEGEYEVFDLNEDRFEYKDYKDRPVAKAPLDEGNEQDEITQFIEEQKALELQKSTKIDDSDLGKLLADLNKVEPAHVRYQFQKDFGAPHVPFEHHVFDPPVDHMHPSVLVMRRKGIGVRAGVRRRTARYKEFRILPFLDEAIVSNDIWTVRRGIAMAMELRSQTTEIHRANGVMFLGYSLLQSLVAARKRLQYLLSLTGERDDDDGFAKEPPLKPIDMTDSYLKDMKEIPPIRAKEWHKFTLAQLSELKKRIGVRPEEWQDPPLRKQPTFAPVCWGARATEARKLALENHKKAHETSEEREARRLALLEEKEMLKQKLASQNVLSIEQISQASESETQLANRMVFGTDEPMFLQGSLIRINIHSGPTDHFGERGTVSLGPAPRGYYQTSAFFAYDFPFPNTTQYDVYSKTTPVPRIKICSHERVGLMHRPEGRDGKVGEEHEADDKHLGWTFEFSFHAFYDPKHRGTMEMICSEMYNPYRTKLSATAPRGGWTRLFAMYAYPASMYNVFQLTTGRAPPNGDVMIDFHRISMLSSLENDTGDQFIPQFSFYGFDRPIPNTKKYMVHERKDLKGATRISCTRAHRSNIVDEEEETEIEWDEVYHFYAWEMAVRGTTKLYVQVADNPHRYKISNSLAERPWRPLLTFYAYVARRGYEELTSQREPQREGQLGGTAEAARMEKKKAQAAVHAAFSHPGRGKK